MYDPKNADERERVEKVVYDMVDRALDMEGSCTVIAPPLSHNE
jgi:D-lactate dehydrogenase (cytochrome)